MNRQGGEGHGHEILEGSAFEPEHLEDRQEQAQVGEYGQELPEVAAADFGFARIEPPPCVLDFHVGVVRHTALESMVECGPFGFWALRLRPHGPAPPFELWRASAVADGPTARCASLGTR